MRSNGESTDVKICGLKRRLHWTPGPSGVAVPHLDICGDVVLTNAAAGVLAARLARMDWDLLAGPAPDCLPLLHVVSSFLGREHYLPLYRGGAHAPIDCVQLREDDPAGWTVKRADLPRLRDSQVMLLTIAACGPDPLRGAGAALEAGGGIMAGRAAVLASQDLAAEEQYVYAGLLPT